MCDRYDWCQARADDGRVYYFNEASGAVQWDPPSLVATAQQFAEALFHTTRQNKLRTGLSIGLYRRLTTAVQRWKCQTFSHVVPMAARLLDAWMRMKAKWKLVTAQYAALFREHFALRVLFERRVRRESVHQRAAHAVEQSFCRRTSGLERQLDAAQQALAATKQLLADSEYKRLLHGRLSEPRQTTRTVRE